MKKTSEYKRYRRIGGDLNEQFMSELKRPDIKNAGRLLGILKKDALVVDGDVEIDRFMDFALNDYKNVAGKSAVLSYKEKHYDKLSNQQKKIIDATLEAKSSLYQVNKVDKKNRLLYLSDVIEKGEELSLMDIGFSSSEKIINHLIYTRIISIGDINMTSGAAYLFEKSDQTLLLETYNKLLKKAPVKNIQMAKAIAFFKLNKKMGSEVQYGEV